MRPPLTSKSEPPLQPTSGKPNPKRTNNKRAPDLEVAFGARIRAARISAGLSQTGLGSAVGISFQQVQKYEKGADRIAASTLQHVATALGVSPGSFYDDAPMPSGSIANVKAALKAAEVLQQIRNPRVLKQLLNLAKVLAEEEAGTALEAEIEQPFIDSDEEH